jgi:hypothetical protein
VAHETVVRNPLGRVEQARQAFDKRSERVRPKACGLSSHFETLLRIFTRHPRIQDGLGDDGL